MDDDNPWFENLFLNNPVPRFIFNLRTLKVERVNAAAVDQYGYTETEFLTKTLYDLRPEEDFNHLNEVLSQVQDNDIYIGDVRHRKKNGELIWVQVSAHPIVYNGSPARLVQSLDITDKKTHEAQILQIQNRYQALIEHSEDIITVTDIHENINYVSPAFLKVTGYNAEEVLNHPGKDFLPAELVHRLPEIKRVLLTCPKKTIHMVDRIKCSDGSFVRIEGTVSNLLDEGVVQGIVSNFREIKEGMREEEIDFEEQLKLSEQRYNALVREGSDLINIVDFEGNYKYISPSVRSSLDPHALGKNAFQFVHEDDRDKLRQELDLLHKFKRVKSSPYRFKVGEDKYIWMETVGTNLMDEPSVEGIVINSHDVSDTINHIKAIEERNTRLEEIAWIHAHLVRAPLASILGIIEILRTSGSEFEELMPYLEQSALQLDKIIGEITQKANGVTT